MADITPLLSNGPSVNRVDIVFVAEGYTAAERTKFLTDANNFLNIMLGSANARLNAPFSAYKGLFNASALFVASAESGTDQPNNNIYVNTYFNATQHGSDGRLLYGDEYKVTSAVGQAYAANAHELTVVLVNTALYGGAGGGVAWASAGNTSSAEVALHEIGHSFAGLQDEYVDTSIASNYLLSDYGFLHSAHVTDSLSRIPWSAWLGYQDGELGTIGTYEGGYYRATGIWRATQDSKMNHLNKPFSAPEKEAFALKYYTAIGDYLALNSNIPGLYQASTPDSSLLSFTWKINGNSVDTSSKLYYDAYTAGTYATGATLSLTTVDNSGYIRQNLSSTQQVETVSMAKPVIAVSGSNYSLASGDVILQCDGADNTVNLSNPGAAQNVYIDGGTGKDTLQFNARLANGSGYFIDALAKDTVLLGMQNIASWATHHVEKLQFSDFSVNTGVTSNAHSVSATVLSSLEELYVAYFNRVPDADGLDYWVTQYKSGMSLQQISDSFFSAALQYSTQTGYSANLSNTEFINIIYKNVLGRPEGADQSGLNYWLGNLSSSTDTRSSMVGTILSAAHTYKGDATWGWVANLLDNKITVANKFAVDWGLNYNSPEASISNGIAIAAAITASDISTALTLIGIADGQIHLI